MTVSSFAFAHRRPDLSREQFVDHWRSRHAPLVREVGYLRGYVQNAPRDLPIPPGWSAADYDGIAGFAWDDPADAARPASDRYVRAEIVPDERRFLDLERLAMLQTEPRSLVRAEAFVPGAAAVKVLFCIARRAGREPRDVLRRCEDLWRQVAEGVDRCVFHRARLEEAPSPEPFDAVVECWWSDPGRYERWCADGANAAVVDDVWMDVARSCCLVATEHVVVGPRRA